MSTSVSSLTTPERNGQFILTTDQLAQAFESTPNTLLKNFRRHKEHFVEQIHYYLLEGEELKQFLAVAFAEDSQSPTNVVEDSQSPANIADLPERNANKIRNLYLWTLKGAFEHAWLLRSSQAKQAYEKMADQATQTSSRLQQENTLLRDQVQLYLGMVEESVRMPGLSEEGIKHIESLGVGEALTRLHKAYFTLEKHKEIIEKQVPKGRTILKELRQAVLDACNRSVDADTELVMVSRNYLQQERLIAQLHTDLENVEKLEQATSLYITEHAQ